jgi:hypothetical protein
MPEEVTNALVELDDLKAQLIEDDGTLSIIEQTSEDVPVYGRTVRMSSQSVGNAFTAGHPVNGIVGTANGVNGSQILVGSSYKGSSVVVLVDNLNNEFHEFLRVSDFVDTTETTATVDTTTFRITF